MYKGDISNDYPKRVLVVIDPILIVDTVVERKYLVFKSAKSTTYYDKFLLNKLNTYAIRANVNLEMVSFDHSDKELEVMYNEIYRTGINPFLTWQAYASPKALAKDLLLRPEVVGVIDIPERRLSYGHWALDF